MLLDKKNSGLILVDVQKKLLPFIYEKDSLLENCAWVLQIAKEFAIPGIISEQYPKGLGATQDSLVNLVANSYLYVEKQDFSFYSEKHCVDAWKSLQKKQVVLIGIETHVCILQTAIDMQQAGYEVFVVKDCVGARKQIDHKAALKRMQLYNIQLLTKEMVFFEWCKSSRDENFKALSKKYLAKLP